MNNTEISQAFIDNSEGETPNKAFFTEVINGVCVVYSWGYHFPIAINFKDGFLFNKDGYSVSTARHKRLILNLIEDDLSDEDNLTTSEIKAVVEKIRYSDLKSKAELIETKI